MSAGEIAGLVSAIVAVIATACTGAYFIVRLHTRASDAKHLEHERRLASIENALVSGQAAMSEMRTGIAVLLERTKHLGSE